MSEITITAFVTAFFGIFGAVVGWVVISFYLEPIKELKREIAMITNKLVFWAAALSNPGHHVDKSEAYIDFRKSSSMIRAKYYSLPCRRLLGLLIIIPSQKNIKLGCQRLIFLSNIVTTGSPTNNQIAIDHIEDAKADLCKAFKIETNFD